MAAAAAAEFQLRAIVIERKHQAGRKLLMCANNRCNLSNDLPPERMIEAYGPGMAEFLAPAISAFSPADLRNWFRKQGLKTTVHKDGKVFPESEKSADVLHFFSDQMRLAQMPVVYNAPVTAIAKDPAGLRVVTRNFSLVARWVLVATGGVSYPKTGSVGDGQKIAKSLGHRLIPYRPGLVGFEIAESWLTRCGGGALSGTRVRIVANGQPIGETAGEIEFSHQGVRGPAIVDASRLVARVDARDIVFEIDLCPRFTADEVAEFVGGKLAAAGGDTPRALAGWLMPPGLAKAFSQAMLPGKSAAKTIAGAVKHWIIHPTKPRPLKEAMVTVGGVSRDDVDPQTMQSRLVPGLFFCGEVLDIDGPTGGYNLHAAFATARQAVAAIARQCAGRKSAP